jgi:hypothetical protein
VQILVTFLLVYILWESVIDNRAGLGVVEKASTGNQTTILLQFNPESIPYTD